MGLSLRWGPASCGLVVLGRSLLLSLRSCTCARGLTIPVLTGLFWEQMLQYFRNSKGGMLSLMTTEDPQNHNQPVQTQPTPLKM